MYQTCPKCGYQRQASDIIPESQCPACGLIFSRWLKQRFRSPESSSPKNRNSKSDALLGQLKERVLYVESPVSHSGFYGRLLLFVCFAFWGFWFIQTDYSQLTGGLPEINGSFMHLVDLIFHEAGHILFIPFGQFMTILGGSLAQLMMPMAVIGVFLLQQRDTFGASIGLWWLGQSVMDLAPYINDARAGELLLLGGTTGRDNPGHHDWRNILGDLGLLEYDHLIAGGVNFMGEALILLSLVWGGNILYRQYQNLAR